ncbi:MAG: hypothetical protein GY895_03850 [Phycisphaera sp.]|nr:hypothetical protein [Phycisphaera sp.]
MRGRWRWLVGFLRFGSRGEASARPPADPHGLGRYGEDLAIRFLADSGLRIVARNRRIAGVEIDVVADCPRERLLLLVEVKTVRGNRPPEARVDRTRRHRLTRAASSLSRKHAVAIEVVAINICPSGPTIRRIRFDPADLEEGDARSGGRMFNGR